MIVKDINRRKVRNLSHLKEATEKEIGTELNQHVNIKKGGADQHLNPEVILDPETDLAEKGADDRRLHPLLGQEADLTVEKEIKTEKKVECQGHHYLLRPKKGKNALLVMINSQMIHLLNLERSLLHRRKHPLKPLNFF